MEIWAVFPQCDRITQFWLCSLDRARDGKLYWRGHTGYNKLKIIDKRGVRALFINRSISWQARSIFFKVGQAYSQCGIWANFLDEDLQAPLLEDVKNDIVWHN